MRNFLWSIMTKTNKFTQGPLNKTIYQISTGKPPGEYQQAPVYAFDVIAHYDQICKCHGQGGHISILPSFPMFQVSKKFQVAVKQRYSTRNYIYLVRFQFTTENMNEEQVIRETVNFPVSYDNLGDLLFFLEHDQTSLELDETTSKGHMKLKVGINLQNKRVEMSLVQGHGESTLTLSLSQYKLLMESMKQGLSIVTGWQIPHQFINQIEFNKRPE